MRKKTSWRGQIALYIYKLSLQGKTEQRLLINKKKNTNRLTIELESLLKIELEQKQLIEKLSNNEA